MEDRVEKWLKSEIPGLTRRQAKEAIELGLVVGMGKTRLAKGDRTRANIDGLSAYLAEISKGNPNLKVEIIRKEKDFLVVDKPPGISSQPIGLQDTDTLTHWALHHFPEIRKKFRVPQPILTPHRLDRFTSGVQIVCLTPESFLFWRKKFSAHEVKKRYLAWCWGEPKTQNFENKRAIAHHPHDRRRMIVPSGGARFRPPLMEARTRVRVLQQDGKLFLCEASCETGITHQIRVHLANLGFALVGDKLYGDRPSTSGHHLLRAISIETERFTFHAPSGTFEKWREGVQEEG